MSGLNNWQAIEQTCDKSFPMSSPVNRFIDNGDGTLTDVEPDLTWMRCSLGQVWNGTTCKGTPATYTWKSAQDAPIKINREGGYANHQDWHLPQIRELASIAERQCSNPRINLALFPATPAAYFWTTTMRPGSAKDDPYAFEISCGSEGPEHINEEKMLYVRLVSAGLPQQEPDQRLSKVAKTTVLHSFTQAQVSRIFSKRNFYCYSIRSSRGVMKKELQQNLRSESAI